MLKKLTIVFASMLLIGIAFVVYIDMENDGGGSSGTVAADTRSAVQRFVDNYGNELRRSFEEAAMLFGDGASIDIAAGTGEKFIFTFTFGPYADIEELVLFMEGLTPILIPEFEELAVRLRYELGVDSLAVTVRFKDFDGGLQNEIRFFS